MSKLELTQKELDDKIEAAVTAAVTEATTKAAGEMAAITKNRDELLAEKREAKQKLKDAEDAKAAAERKAAEESGDVEQVKVALEKKHAEELAAKDAIIAPLEDFRYNALVNNGLTSALAEHNVPEAQRPAVTALLKSANKIEIADNNATVDGKPLGDFVKNWAATDAGKVFVTAPRNGGVPQPGGPGGAGGDKTRSQMSHAEKGAYVREHGSEAYNALPI